MRVQTKIICTIGPAVSSVEKMIELIEAGMNVARLNFSHGSHEQHKETIVKLKEARKKTGAPLTILLDTKGPEIRVGSVKDDKITIKTNQRIKLVEKLSDGIDEIPIDPFSVLENIAVGMIILFDDGYIMSEVVEIKPECVVVKMKNDGVIKSRKGVNIPGAYLNLPAMTQKDIDDIKFGCKEDIDVIAASFIRSSDHVLVMKQLLRQEGYSHIPVIAKIENKEGVENFDDILQVTDGVMVARGDLGVEVPLSNVPILQKMMIRKCYQMCKPVVTATQMLESMIEHPRPTRAEVSDVANAIYDHTSLVMLSGETAVGKYPIATVRQMRSIIKEAESDIDYRDFFNRQDEEDEHHDVSSTVAIAAVEAMYSSNAKAIFVITSSGFTAKQISRLRPNVPIIALTNREKVYHQLALLWGVIPLFSKDCSSSDKALNMMTEFTLDKKLVRFGDLIVLTAGVPYGKKGSTNMLRIESIGQILTRGKEGYGKKKEGKVIVVMSATSITPEDVKGKIIVIPCSHEKYVPLMEKADGVILQNTTGDILSEQHAIETAQKQNIPIIIGAENAMTLLTDNQKIILDPTTALIYKP
jgi:pyruvate kinase